jgi:hypothetical protein
MIMIIDTGYWASHDKVLVALAVDNIWKAEYTRTLIHAQMIMIINYYMHHICKKD